MTPRKPRRPRSDVSDEQRRVLAAAEDRSLHAYARWVTDEGATGFGWRNWNWGNAMEDLDGRAALGLLRRGLIRQGPWLSSGLPLDAALFVLTEAGRLVEDAIRRDRRRGGR